LQSEPGYGTRVIVSLPERGMQHPPAGALEAAAATGPAGPAA
jgi:hypothetical protein